MVAAVDVDEAPVAWRETGDPAAPVVLLLHGLGGSRTAWEPQLAALAPRWRAVAWDMPGYGASPLPAGGLAFDALADAAAGLLDRLGAPSAHVAGLSMGSMVALHLAHRHPSRVRSLALLSTSPRFGFDATTTAEAWVSARLAPLDDGRTPAEMAPAVLRAVAAPGTPEGLLAPQEAAMARIPAEGLRAAVRCLPTHDATPFLASLRVRSLVLVGELDDETPHAYAKAVADPLGAPLLTVPGAGHLLPAEAADTIDQVLVAFFAGVEAGEGGAR